tara:strand:+ start:166 stop:510 length:345 start_codon:yes stop_codon:yes gene_type:complete
MGKNKNKHIQGVIYSTNKNFEYDYYEPNHEKSISPNLQDLRILLDRKKGGKVVTTISNFIGPKDDLRLLGKELKTKCGVGGTIKNDEIIIQGDFREKILGILLEKGFKAKKKGG